MFCNVTTAIGLGSLYASEIVPIRKFGVYSAWGVVAMLAILFFYLPAALTIWPDRKKAERLMRKEHEKKHSGIEEWMDHAWALFGGWVIRRHRLVLTASTVLMAFVAYGLMHTRTEIDLLKLFHPSARILHDYVWLEERLGRLIPMEIVLRFNPQSQADPNRADPTDPQRFYQLSFLERMESVALVQDVIERQFGVNAADVVGRSMSAATFAPPIDAESTSTLSFAPAAD